MGETGRHSLARALSFGLGASWKSIEIGWMKPKVLWKTNEHMNSKLIKIEHHRKIIETYRNQLSLGIGATSQASATELFAFFTIGFASSAGWESSAGPGTFLFEASVMFFWIELRTSLMLFFWNLQLLSDPTGKNLTSQTTCFKPLAFFPP